MKKEEKEEQQAPPSNVPAKQENPIEQGQVQDLNIKVKIPNTAEALFKDRHPIITSILTVELGLGFLAFFSYMYVYSYKASYLSYYGIPAFYTEVTLAELLNSSWLIVNLLQILLAILFGCTCILLYSVIKTNHLLKRFHPLVVHIVLQLGNLVLFIYLYWELYRISNETFYVPFGINSSSGVTLGNVFEDLYNNPHIYWTSIFVLLLAIYVQHQKYRRMDDQSIIEEETYQKDNQLYSYRILTLIGLIISGFFIIVNCYTASSYLGFEYAKTKAIYPFLTVEGKVTSEFVVSMYKDSYIVMELAPPQPTPGTKKIDAPKTVKDNFRLIKIDQENITLTQLKVFGGIKRKDKTDFQSTENALFQNSSNETEQK